MRESLMFVLSVSFNQMEVLAEAMSAHLDAVTEDQALEAICVMKHIP